MEILEIILSLFYATPFIVVSFGYYYLMSALVYASHRKKESDIKDFRLRTTLYSLISTGVGLVFIILPNFSGILVWDSFESYFFPSLGFLVAVLFNILFQSILFYQDKRYKFDRIKILLLCEPYAFFLLIIYNWIMMRAHTN